MIGGPLRLPLPALQIAGYLHGGRALAGPTTVQVDLTDACNQSCVVCWLHAPALREQHRERLGKPASLPWDLYEQLLHDLRAMGTREIYFAGGGEPMAHPRAWDALAEAVHRGFAASLHTNFSLIDDDGVGRLIDLGVHHVTVSLWAGTREQYAATHPGTRPETFDQVTDRLRELNRRKVDRPTTKLYHVLTAANGDDVEAMIALAAELGCDAVEVAVADVIPGATDPFALRADQAGRAAEQLADHRGRAPWRTPRLLGLDATLDRLGAIAAGRAADADLVHELPCFAGWTYSRVMADGRVVPCLKAHRIPSGNLHDDPFGRIWRGERQRAFRQAGRAVRKEGALFASIGNDPDAACGCELGCDNLADNRRTAEQLAALTGIERGLLRTVAAVPGLAAATAGPRS